VFQFWGARFSGRSLLSWATGIGHIFPDHAQAAPKMDFRDGGLLVWFGGFIVVILAGVLSWALSSWLSAWLGLGEETVVYVQFGLFFVVVITTSLVYDKLRDSIF
jgi:hypothetical protein